jgi:hypothetical protein
MRYEIRDIRRRQGFGGQARNKRQEIRNKFFVLASKAVLPLMTMASVVACEKPTPEPPTPPTPPKPTTQKFEVDTIDELTSAAATPAKENNKIIIDWDGDITVNNNNDNKIGESIDIDAKRDDMTINTNGYKIIYGYEVVKNTDWKRDTKSHSINTSGTVPYAYDDADVQAWIASGYPQIMVQKTSARIELTAENAARFDRFIDELKSAYTQGVIMLDFGEITIPSITMEKLLDFTSDEIRTGGRIAVKNFKVKSIKSTAPKWQIGVGMRSAEWFWLSQINGVTPEIVWNVKAPANGDVPPELYNNIAIEIADSFVKQENIVSGYVSGRPSDGNAAVRGDFILLDATVLPSAAPLTIDETGAIWEGWGYYEWKSKKFALAAWNIPDLDKKMKQTVPLTVLDPTSNANLARDWLLQHGVTPDTSSHIDSYKWLNCYTSSEHALDKDIQGKSALQRPAWAADMTAKQKLAHRNAQHIH